MKSKKKRLKHIFSVRLVQHLEHAISLENRNRASQFPFENPLQDPSKPRPCGHHPISQRIAYFDAYTIDISIYPSPRISEILTGRKLPLQQEVKRS